MSERTWGSRVRLPMRCAWGFLAVLGLMLSMIAPIIPTQTALAQDDGTPAVEETEAPVEIATEAPVEVTEPPVEVTMPPVDVTEPPVDETVEAAGVAVVTFRLVDVNDQPIDQATADGYKACIDGTVTCVDFLLGQAQFASIGDGSHTYTIKWKVEGETGPYQDKTDTFTVDSTLGENIVKVMLQDSPVVSPTASTEATTPASTETSTAASTATASATTTATSTVTVSPSSTATNTTTATATQTNTPTITPTLAPTSGKVSGTGGGGLNCRSAASLSASVITVLPEGATVQYRGTASNGWQPVTCAGKPGYISTTYVSNIPATPVATKTPTATATVSTTVIATSTGTITVTTTVTTTTTATSTATSTPVAGGKVTGTGGVGLNCRRTPSTAGVIITTLPEGSTIVYRGAASNGWQPVTCAGQAGYISTSYVTNTTITPTPSVTVTATTTATPSGNSGMVSGTGGGGLNCRQQPSTSGAIITTLPEGSVVQFTGPASNGWQPVICAGKAGFISTAYITGIAIGSGELWVDVNLSTQYMRVYRGSTVILGTYVSTGRPGFDTPTGTWRVNTKLPSQTMSGVIGGEYYNVPDVPWVMYFTNWGHAIHGAYWHNNFGHTMSHGCVNLPVGTAAWLYAQAPIGMRVVIHY